ncbi:MAG: NDP-sugar synthase [Dehalococcoidales bacterium]
MKAVILVGGLGTRLRPLTINTPKAMVPVVNRPFLEYVIRRLSGHGAAEIVLAQSHLAQPIEDYFGDGGRFGVGLNYVLEKTALGTAGAVKNAEKYLDETFLVLNGDIFTDLDITAMTDFHRKKKAKVTIALTPVDDPTSYGLIETTAQGRVSRFLEKPSWDQVTTNMINAGTYILEPEVISHIPPQTNFSFERQLFPFLLDRGEPVYAYPSPCYWIDIGTPEKYFRLNKDLLSGKSNQYQPAAEGEQGSTTQAPQIIGTVAIGRNCTIGWGVRLIGPVVIGRDCILLDEAVVEESVIWHNVEMGTGATIRRSIIANNCRLGAGSVVEDSVLGDAVTVSDGYKLEAGSRLWPGAIVG